MKYRKQILSIALTIIFILSVLSLVSFTEKVSAFPSSSPQPADYIFLDNFEGYGAVTGWTTPLGPVHYSTDQAYQGSSSAKFDVFGRDGENCYIARDFAADSDPRNEGVIVECKFYDNASVVRNDPEIQFRMIVGNPAMNVAVGLKLNCTPLAQRVYSFWAYDENWAGGGYKYQSTGIERTTGWHDFKIHILDHQRYFIYVDNIFAGNITLINNDGAVYMHLFAAGDYGNPAAGQVWYVDQFMVYRFFQDTPWKFTKLAINNNLAWNAYAIEPTVLYENGVYRCWYAAMDNASGHNYIGYATSTNAVDWTSSPSPLCVLGPSYYGAHPFFAHIGDTYYCYYVNGSSTYHNWEERRTSADGISWSAPVVTDLRTDSADPSWSHKMFGNICVWKEGVTWYAIYEADSNESFWTCGLATSTDGLHWTPYANNPVLPPWYTGGNPEIHKLNGVYYLFLHGILTRWINNVPTDIYLMTSTDLVHWTNSTFFCQYTRMFAYWGMNYQVADMSYFAGEGAQTGTYYLMVTGTINGTDQGRCYILSSKYSVEDIASGRVDQWGTHFMDGIGVTNNVTTSGKYWYSGINAMNGAYTDNMTVVTTSDVNVTVTARGNKSIAWTSDSGTGSPVVNYTISGLEPDTVFYLCVDQSLVKTMRSSSNGTLSFTLSSYSGEHAITIDFTMVNAFGLIWMLLPVLVVVAVVAGVMPMLFDAGSKGSRKK